MGDYTQAKDPAAWGVPEDSARRMTEFAAGKTASGVWPPGGPLGFMFHSSKPFGVGGVRRRNLLSSAGETLATAGSLGG